ncbi:hypothetical protein [Nonomuraea sp. NPDC049695]|uniref:hypothetical protein n=1 Tax=Nonomuraea sp. NPDC049695 TaxID=3154734 RepID=UPI00344471A1
MAVALTGAVAGLMFLPFGQGVAGASAGFPAVQAGGPPAPAPQAAPRVHVQKKIVHHRPHRHRNFEEADVQIFNRNNSFNFDNRRDFFSDNEFNRDRWEKEDFEHDHHKPVE